VHEKKLLLAGRVTEVSRLGFSPQPELVTFSVDGAEPLWSEVRVPNEHGWAVGDRVLISIEPIMRTVRELS
jgi:hypothetical protein